MLGEVVVLRKTLDQSLYFGSGIKSAAKRVQERLAKMARLCQTQADLRKHKRNKYSRPIIDAFSQF